MHTPKLGVKKVAVFNKDLVKEIAAKIKAASLLIGMNKKIIRIIATINSDLRWTKRVTTSQSLAVGLQALRQPSMPQGGA